MSAGALAATLAVAFVGGASGAVIGPVVSHRFGKHQRLAERRQGPYHELIAVAQDFLLISQRIARPDRGESVEQWSDARVALTQTMNNPDTDPVASSEVRRLVEELSLAGSKAAAARPAPPDAPEEKRLEATELLLSTQDRLIAAYEALRDQVTRETNG
jgi:hypothetical protein